MPEEWDFGGFDPSYRNKPVDTKPALVGDVEPPINHGPAGDYGDLFDHLGTELRQLVRCALTMEDVAMDEGTFATEYGVIASPPPWWLYYSNVTRRRHFYRVDTSLISLPRVERRP